MRTITYTVPGPDITPLPDTFIVTDSITSSGSTKIVLKLQDIISLRESTTPYIKFIFDFGDGTENKQIAHLTGYTTSTIIDDISHTYQTSESIYQHNNLRIKGIRSDLQIDEFNINIRLKRSKVKPYGNVDLIKTHIFDVDEEKYGVLLTANILDVRDKDVDKLSSVLLPITKGLLPPPKPDAAIILDGTIPRPPFEWEQYVGNPGIFVPPIVIDDPWVYIDPDDLDDDDTIVRIKQCEYYPPSWLTPIQFEPTTQHYDVYINEDVEDPVIIEDTSAHKPGADVGVNQTEPFIVIAQDDKTPRPSTFLTTWPRFYGNSFFQPFNIPSTSPASYWFYSNTPSPTFVQPTNTGRWNGFISNTYDEYWSLDAVLYSSNLDDDANGIVGAFSRTNNRNRGLFFCVTHAGTQPTRGWGLLYVDGVSVTVLHQLSAPDGPGNKSDPNWDGWYGWGSANGVHSTIRVHVERVGNYITAKCSNWGTSADINRSDHILKNNSTISVNLSSGQIYTDATGWIDTPYSSTIVNVFYDTPIRYGLCNHSQAASRYLDIAYSRKVKYGGSSHLPAAAILSLKTTLTGQNKWSVDGGTTYAKISGNIEEHVDISTDSKTLTSSDYKLTADASIHSISSTSGRYIPTYDSFSLNSSTSGHYPYPVFDTFSIITSMSGRYPLIGYDESSFSTSMSGRYPLIGYDEGRLDTSIDGRYPLIGYDEGRLDTSIDGRYPLIGYDEGGVEVVPTGKSINTCPVVDTEVTIVGESNNTSPVINYGMHMGARGAFLSYDAPEDIDYNIKEAYHLNRSQAIKNRIIITGDYNYALYHIISNRSSLSGNYTQLTNKSVAQSMGFRPGALLSYDDPEDYDPEISKYQAHTHIPYIAATTRSDFSSGSNTTHNNRVSVTNSLSAGNYTNVIEPIAQYKSLTGSNYTNVIEPIAQYKSLTGSNYTNATETNAQYESLTGSNYTNATETNAQYESLTGGNILEGGDTITKSISLTGDYTNNDSIFQTTVQLSGEYTPVNIDDVSVESSLSGNYSPTYYLAVSNKLSGKYSSIDHHHLTGSTKLSGFYVTLAIPQLIQTLKTPSPAPELTRLVRTATFDEDTPMIDAKACGGLITIPNPPNLVTFDMTVSPYTLDYIGDCCPATSNCPCNYVLKYRGGPGSPFYMSLNTIPDRFVENKISIGSQSYICHVIRESELAFDHTGITQEVWNGTRWTYDEPETTSGYSPEINTFLGEADNHGFEVGSRAIPNTLISINSYNETDDEHGDMEWTADRVTLPWPWYTQAKINNGKWWLPRLATADISNLRADLEGDLNSSNSLTYPAL